MIEIYAGFETDESGFVWLQANGTYKFNDYAVTFTMNRTEYKIYGNEDATIEMMTLPSLEESTEKIQEL